MKYIILVVLTFFITTISSATCLNNNIYCLSKSSSLNKNGLIILEFYASSQAMIPDLNKKYPIYLKSGNSKVQLNIIETLEGEMFLTQIVLRPAITLKAGEVYSLEIDHLPDHERKPERYNDLSQKFEPLTFKINNVVDNDAPALEATPTEKEKTFVHLGCGPAVWVYFTMRGQDKSELFVRTTVKNKTTGKVTSYILPIENGLIKVGHGMCSGAFRFEDSNDFDVTFQLFDQSGNKSGSTDLISFTKPTAPAKKPKKNPGNMGLL